MLASCAACRFSLHRRRHALLCTPYCTLSACAVAATSHTHSDAGRRRRTGDPLGVALASPTSRYPGGPHGIPKLQLVQKLKLKQKQKQKQKLVRSTPLQT